MKFSDNIRLFPVPLEYLIIGFVQDFNFLLLLRSPIQISLVLDDFVFKVCWRSQILVTTGVFGLRTSYMQSS